MTKTRRKVSAAELKRQLNAVKLELAEARKTAPVILKRPGQMEPMEQQIGQDGMVEMSEQNDESFLVRPQQADVDDPEFKAKMDLEAFMLEPVTVYIQTTSEKNAQMKFDINVNGITEVFMRGQTKTVKRYIVEGLARAKPLTYGNEEYTASDGERKVRWPSATGLRFPFSVVEDRNPLGASWLQHVLAQP